MLVRKNKLGLIVAGFFVGLMASSAWAASPQDLRFDARSLTALQKQGSNPSDAAIRTALGLASDESLEAIRTYSDDRGGNVTRYRQKFRGIPVWGEQIIVSKDRTGKVTTLHGRRVAGIGGELRELKPTFTDEQALGSMQERVRERMGIAAPVYTNQRSELVVYVDNDVPRLSYAVSFFADSPSGGRPTRPTFIVDAVSGEVIHEFEGLTHADACSSGCSFLTQSGLSKSRGNWLYFSPFTIPATAPADAQLEITISGGSGDADLYVLKGSTNPTLSTYNCRPYLGGNNEQCVFSAIGGETWTVGIYAYRSFSGLSLVARVKKLIPAQGSGPGGNINTGSYEYSDLEIATDNGACSMTNVNVKTVNLNQGTTGATAYSFVPTSGVCRNTVKEINGAYSPLNDAHYFGGVVFKMYQDYLGLPPLDFPLTMRVHYSTNYENAFWDGSSMTFGDGYSTFYPLVGLDVSSHEVSHGFTEQNSNLTYSGESGGINEAFSDMGGEAAEYYLRRLNSPAGTNDFLVGKEILKSGGALRNMCDPTADGNSIDHISKYTSGLDVHYSSGIYNKAFCELANSSGWNTMSAFQVFALANQRKWTPSTGFVSGAQGVVDALVELVQHPELLPGSPVFSNSKVTDVMNAFKVVGISGLIGPNSPSAPTGLSAVAVSSSQINLAWTDNSTNEVGFTIERSSDGGNTFTALNVTIGSNATTFSNTGLASGRTYTYRIKAYNADGGSAYSNTVSATTTSTLTKGRK